MRLEPIPSHVKTFALLARAIGFCILLVCSLGIQANAQSFEAAIMPGAVSQAHIKQESDCKLCHIRFEPSGQPKLCLDCHKDVAADVRGKKGYHGRMKAAECRTCHTEHKGRGAKIIKLDERTFDHTKTDFPLSGKHRTGKCEACHKPGIKHSATPSTCVACHRKDDKHKDTLGPKCENCHSEIGWKETRFDHSKTRFPLLLRHAKAKCAACHADPKHLANTPRDCIACHRKEDKHKATLGAKCENCHSEGGWKETHFDHAKTEFPLREKHAKVNCKQCHSDLQHFANTSVQCVACHRKDDKHKNSLGEKCESCHSDKAWKGATRFDHDRDSSFPLRESHRNTKCEGCHKDPTYRDKPPATCFGCHERDDREKGHKGRYGEKCETCHTEKAFKAVRFEHARDTKFELRGKHTLAKCDACHKGELYKEKLKTDCFSCHEPDDKHNGQLGKDCARCHAESDWHKTSFDHNKTEFPLRDKHAPLECKKCHATPAFKDVKPACVSCHEKDDRHKKKLGPRCDECHSATGWKDWVFDHNARSRFKLVERHAKAKCEWCHTKPVKEKVELSVECISCHRRDDIHLETRGIQCEKCHAPDNWRNVINQEPEMKRK